MVPQTEVYLLKTDDRKTAIPQLLEQFNLSDFSGKQVAVKANFNSADPFPASTHLDTLRGIMEGIKGAGSTQITLAERSGIGDTREVLEQMGVFALSKELGFQTVVLNEAPREAWTKIERGNSHWLHGFYIANLFQTADKVVETCCLKTHRFGGHFTLAMKCSVGLVAKKVPGSLYDYMWELHGSPFQRAMIAEINQHYNVDAVIMDGMKAFITGGPESGTKVEPNLMLASRDRVAIDAVGVALLKLNGAKGKVGSDNVFQQDQIKRATELGFGIRSPNEIKLVALNSGAEAEVNRIIQMLTPQIIMH
jgi:uncharacterized protein (DUF362 family)